VKKHVTHILGKLEAANRTEAAARARDVGLLDQPERPAFGA
jgi:DNA-binding NarL/FixJ family response regulator